MSNSPLSGTSTQSAKSTSQAATYLGLFIAVLAVSWASIFIRWCGDTPALVIAFYRMLWSFLLFVILFMVNKRRGAHYSRLEKRDRLLIAVAGVMLALHFATWIASLKFTTVAHSLTLESTHPVFALILSPLLLKEKGDWRSVVAVILTFIGIFIIAGMEFSFQSDQFRGDLLAVSSALFVTLYLFVARYLREKIDLISYIVKVYGIAMVVLLNMNLFSRHPLFDYPWQVHLMMAFLALIPTGIGHSLFNWAARRTRAYRVNLSILGEPVLASFLAYIFFQEVPRGWFYLGAAFILLGIGIAVIERKHL